MDNIQIIKPKVHGILDYGVAAALILSPHLFGFKDNKSAAWIVRIIGIMILAQALMTDNETGMIKAIPFSSHLAMDYVIGSFLIASPFLFDFSDEEPNTWVPHVMVGIMILTETTLTQSPN
ncbi:MAG TPA: SPW repeat protein [Candidatus Nitrosocosmicus sp.]|nr:SPW repeat protein [Candidatus Nitrosocosmicus sp.]